MEKENKNGRKKYEWEENKKSTVCFWLALLFGVATLCFSYILIYILIMSAIVDVDNEPVFRIFFFLTIFSFINAIILSVLSSKFSTKHTYSTKFLKNTVEDYNKANTIDDLIRIKEKILSQGMNNLGIFRLNGRKEFLSIIKRINKDIREKSTTSKNETVN